jgi:hypothetical protein
MAFHTLFTPAVLGKNHHYHLPGQPTGRTPALLTRPLCPTGALVDQTLGPASAAGPAQAWPPTLQQQQQPSKNVLRIANAASRSY